MNHTVVTPRKVAFGPLDLDDPRPGIGKSARTQWRGARLLQGEDQHSFQGFHVRCGLSGSCGMPLPLLVELLGDFIQLVHDLEHDGGMGFQKSRMLVEDR